MKRFNRIGSILLCAALTMGLTGCGGCGSAGEEPSVAGKDYTYVASYLEVEDAVKNGNTISDENGVLYSFSYEEIEGSGEYQQQILKLGVEENRLSVMERIPLQMEEAYTIQSFSLDKEGNFHAVGSLYPEEENVTDWEAYQKKVKYSHLIFDAQGNLLAQKDFSSAMQQLENAWIDRLMTDGDGNSVAFSGETLFLFNSQGEFQGTGKMEGWANCYCKGSDGKIYVNYYSDSASGYVIGTVDFASRSVIPTKIASGSVQCMSAGSQGKLLLNNVESFLLADVETGEKEELFQTLSCNLVGDQISSCAMLSDGSVFVASTDWNTGITDYILVKKVKADELVAKKEIVIASLYADSAINNYAVQFNKQSDTTQIVVKNYISNDAQWTENTYADAMTNLKNDLLSGNAGIDLLALSTASELKLGGKEEQIFADLKEYIQKSNVISLEDYFDTVIQNASVGNTLLYLPRSFYLETLIVKNKFVEGKTSWTIEDVAALSKQYPGSSVLGKSMSKTYALQCFMYLYADAFVDETNYTCQFTSDAFKRMLELCASYPDEFDYDDMSSTAELLQSDQMLVYTGYLNNWQAVQMAQAYFGQEDVTYIGYPNNQGVNGTLMTTSSGYAILNASANKEDAWKFVEFVANQPYDRWQDYSFPAKKSEYEAAKQEFTKEEYLLDENGDYVLDESGNKIPEGGTSSISDGSWTYVFHTTTAEEAAIADSLVAQAVPSQYTMNQDILSIIIEEAAPFFQGAKSVDEVCQVIQSRVDIFLKENM